MLQAITAASASFADVAAVLDGTTASLYLPDSAALRAAGADSWGFCPDDVQSLLLQRVSSDTGAVNQKRPSNGSSAQYVSTTSAKPGALECMFRMTCAYMHCCTYNAR
jgi:hypothetical protein